MIGFFKQLDYHGVLQCLKSIEKERKNFNASYCSLVKLGEKLRFVEDAGIEIDLAIFTGKFKKLQKAVIVYPIYCDTSKITAERLMAFYKQCGVSVSCAVSILDAEKLLV